MVKLWLVNTQISPAIPRAVSTISRADRSVFFNSALAAAWAKPPPEPMAIRPCSGSTTSPLPVMIRDASLLATASMASRRLRERSVRHSLASSTAARTRWPWCFSSWPSKRSNRVKASAVAPAKPASTWPWYRRRTFFALPFITVLPRETWPSPPMTTLPWRRTETMVVKRRVSTQRGENALVGTDMGVVGMISTLGGWYGRMVSIGLTHFREPPKTNVGGAVRRFDLAPIAVYQSPKILTDLPLSGASPLPH